MPTLALVARILRVYLFFCLFCFLELVSSLAFDFLKCLLIIWMRMTI